MKWSFPDLRRRRRWPAPALAVLALLLVACGEAVTTPAPLPLRPVKYMVVQPERAAQQQIFTGQARAAVESTLSFKVSGTVNTMPVKVGDRVSRGELIAALVPVDYEIGVQQAVAAVSSADAEFRSARANYERVRSLYENSSASKGELDQARARFESARAQLRTAEKKLESARRQLTYTRLLAPQDCSIAATYVTVNENVSPGEPITEITCGDAFEVEIAVPELLIAGIREGDSASIRFDALAGEQFAGRVTEVGVSATDVSTTFPVMVEVLAADARVRAGMAAEVLIEYGDGGSDRIVLPPVSVGEDRAGRFVYLLDAPGPNGSAAVRRRAVEVGQLSHLGLEIRSGISFGERVVVAGISRLQDGMTVKAPDAGAP